jgi:hypothetical protein
MEKNKKTIDISKIIQSERYQELLRVEIKNLRDQRDITIPYKKSTFDDFIGYEMSLIDCANLITLKFKEMLLKESLLPAKDRLYIKALCDLTLHRWIREMHASV